MVLGIISDTHGWFHPAINEVFADVDQILHAGDFGTAAILDSLEAIAPTTGVYGNVDGQEIRRRCKEVAVVRVEGVTLAMLHIAGAPGRFNATTRAAIAKYNPDVLVCGHSHILRIERVKSAGNLLYLNPGAAGRQGFHQKKTCVRLHIADGTLQQAEVIHLDEPAADG